MPSIDVMKLAAIIVKIRNSADRITASGHENCELISFIYNTCNDILKQLDHILTDIQKEGNDHDPDQDTSGNSGSDAER